MATRREYFLYVTSLLNEVSELEARPMMGEYVLYSRGKVFGGVYDDRFLVKDTPASRRMLPDAEEALPYKGARPMLEVSAEDPMLLAEMIDAMYPELPDAKGRKKK